MTMTYSSTTLSPSDLTDSLELVEVKEGWRSSLGALREMLPDAESVLFFGKVFELDYIQLSTLMSKVLNSSVSDALFGGAHSTELQDYVLDTCGDYFTSHQMGQVVFDPTIPSGEILPEVWKSIEVEVATSIKEVAAKLGDTVSKMPGKQGRMLMNSMMVLNKKRPTIGDYRAGIHHARQAPNLVILDVSGSMSETTVRTLVDDVVAMSYLANASFAIVSNTCTYWEPGTYDSASVLAASEFGGTHYETLRPLFDQSWGTVVTIADYDSAWDARAVISQSPGTIDQVLDISLVNRPTFLSEVVGQLAGKVRPLLIGNSEFVL